MNPSRIHPTAIIHPSSQVGEGCEIGPYCVIEEQVVLGEGCRLHSHVVLGRHTTLGRRNEVFPFASIGMRTQDLKWDGGITHTRIGDNNIIRECVTINSATGDGECTTIGSHNSILASSHVAHNSEIGDHVILSSAGLAGHVVVEDYAIVGGMAAVHQFCRVGRMSFIGGCAKVVQDTPPFMIVDGNPAVTRTINKIGLERNAVPEATQTALRQAYRILFREGLSIPNALARIEEDLPELPELKYLVDFVRRSERGISK